MKSIASRVWLVGSFAALSELALASLAVRLDVSNNPCIAEPCPGTVVFPTTVVAGAPFLIFVAALDSENSRDPNFTGTVNFASTDALASLPPSFSFTPANEGSTRGGLVTILRTPGNQTITVTDAAGKLLPGSFVMTVTAIEPVPTISAWMKAGFTTVLAVLGLWFGRLRA